VFRWISFFPDGRNYGAKVNELLAKDLTVVEAEVKGVSNLFWKARNVARNLSKAEARAWSKKQNERGDPLSAYHVLKLVSIQDKVKRDQLLNDCLQQCWSVARLEKEVQNSFGYLRSGGRRKSNPRPAPSPAIALREIQINSAAWLENHKLWQKAMQALLRRLSTQQMEKLSGELAGAKKKLIAVQNALKEDIDDLKRLYQEGSRGS
jgi:predicted nuclease of restriction endonuclease-like (RecB) superfamily